MIESNIKGGFRKAELIPYNPDSVILQLDISLSILIPPSILLTLLLLWESKTPNNPFEV
jgi:hypothetical protein